MYRLRKRVEITGFNFLNNGLWMQPITIDRVYHYPKKWESLNQLELLYLWRKNKNWIASKLSTHYNQFWLKTKFIKIWLNLLIDLALDTATTNPMRNTVKSSAFILKIDNSAEKEKNVFGNSESQSIILMWTNTLVERTKLRKFTFNNIFRTKLPLENSHCHNIYLNWLKKKTFKNRCFDYQKLIHIAIRYNILVNRVNTHILMYWSNDCFQTNWVHHTPFHFKPVETDVSRSALQFSCSFVFKNNCLFSFLLKIMHSNYFLLFRFFLWHNYVCVLGIPRYIRS